MRVIITLPKVKGVLKRHLGLHLKFFSQVFNLAPKLIVLFDKLNDVGVEIQNSLVEFQVVNFLNSLCNFLSIV